MSVSPDTQDNPSNFELHSAQNASTTGVGICRTCALPIWREEGTCDGRKAEGWSDRHPGRDSLVCFKAVGYRHVPLDGREAALWDAAVDWSVRRLIALSPEGDTDPQADWTPQQRRIQAIEDSIQVFRS